VIVIVASKPGREWISFETIASLTRQNPGWPFWVYRSTGECVSEFWKVLHAARGTSLLFLEDDILTSRSFFDYAAAWDSPHTTSFFHCGRPLLGEPVSPEAMSFTQAVKIPAPVLEGLCGLKRKRGKHPENGGQDDDLGRALEQLGESIIYHRSLVQHTGIVSLGWPGATLEKRVASDFPGQDFDCATLIKGPRR
jgi:hypothetical protein